MRAVAYPLLLFPTLSAIIVQPFPLF